MNPQFQDLFAPTEIFRLMRVVLILVGAAIVSLLLNRVISGLLQYVITGLKERQHADNQEAAKRAATIGGILRKTGSVVIYSLAIVMALRELNFDVVPLIAGAGVVGLAIGFGAQNLVRDAIAGFFIIIEGQIRVGDVAVINDISGVVEEINLRTTVLRDIEGTVHVFPNGAIAKLANRTREFSYYVFTLYVAYKDDPDDVIRILEQTATEVAAEPAYAPLVLQPIELFGVDKLAESHMVIKARIKTLPGKQWVVGREINRRVRARLAEANMEFPLKGPRRVEVVTSMPTQEELRMLVLDVLREERARDV